MCVCVCGVGGGGGREGRKERIRTTPGVVFERFVREQDSGER